MKINYILGVDPGRTAGWGLVEVENEKLIDYGTCGSTKQACKGYLVVSVLKDRVIQGETAILVEDQFLSDETEEAREVDIIATSRHAGGWLYLADVYSVRRLSISGSNGAGLVLPRTWRKLMLGVTKDWERNTPKLKEAAMSSVLYRTGKHPPSDHVAEAILIALYGAIQLKAQGLRAR